MLDEGHIVVDGVPVADPVVWTIVVAAGEGHRFGSQKQFAELGGRRVVDWAVTAAAGVSAGVVTVLPADRAAAGEGIAGGATRSESVRRGLAAVPAEAAIVCVHDAARPFATTEIFERVIAAVRSGADAAVPGLPVTDTIKLVATDGRVVATPPRAELRAVQTPQAFVASVLRAAHRGDPDASDDAALVEAAGGRVVVVEGDASNRKITSPDDLDWARARVESGQVAP